MNIELLRALVVDELRNLRDAQGELLRVLPKMEAAVISPEVRQSVRDQVERERRQVSELSFVFSQLAAVEEGGRSVGMRGILEEAGGMLRRVSGVDPTNLDSRLLLVLRKTGHYKMASLRFLTMMVHYLEAEEIEAVLERFLQDEIDADRACAELADDMVRLACAESRNEARAAL